MHTGLQREIHYITHYILETELLCRPENKQWEQFRKLEATSMDVLIDSKRARCAHLEN